MEDEKNLVLVLINLAYADYQLTQEEKAWLLKIVKNYEFNNEQRSTIQHEIDHPNLEYIIPFKNINSPFLRNKAIEFARHLFGIDHKLSPNENKAYEHLIAIQSELSAEIPSLNQDDQTNNQMQDKLLNELDEFGQSISFKQHYIPIKKYIASHYMNWLQNLFIFEKWVLILGFAVLITLSYFIALILF